MKNEKIFILGMFIILIIVLFWGVLLLFQDNSLSGGCSLSDIEYVDVSPSECWNGAFNETYCPLPHNIKCEGNVENLGNLIFNMVE